MTRNLPASFAILSALVLSASAALAADAPQHIRGTIESCGDHILMIHTREGESATVHLADKVNIAAVAAAGISDIKKGDFVGIASLPSTDGVAGALEVLIFPAALKGTGEGSYGWDLKPKSTMTNATVSNAVEGVDGRTVTVNYGGTKKEIKIPEGTPVVTLVGAGEADLVKGAMVFITAHKDGDDFTSDRVVVGKDGVVPPM